jgi:hypothetical protein
VGCSIECWNLSFLSQGVSNKLLDPVIPAKGPGKSFL